MTTQSNNKLRGYVNAFYAFMDQNAEDEIIRGSKVTVWRGFIRKSCDELGMPNGTEKRLIGPLTDMGCIQLIQRGVNIHPSVVVLFNPPTEDLWEQLEPRQNLTRRMTYATMGQDLRAVQKQIGGVNLKELAKNFEDRISAIETFLEKNTNFKKYGEY
jgi:hypothetical protein